MAYTVTTSTSWFQRLGSSFRGIVTGVVLVIVGTILLWWNEGNFVKTGDALTEAQGVTQQLGDISTVDSSKNGQLVHATGDVATEDMLTDPIFNVSANAIRIERTVEFFQWVEHSKEEKRQKLGGGEETVTTYTYEKDWVSKPIDSSRFVDPNAVKRNQNFILANIENFKTQATNVSFGAYRLPEFLISSISGAVPWAVELPEETKASLTQQISQMMPATSAAPSTAVPNTAATQSSSFYNLMEEQVTQPAAPAQELVHVQASTIMLSASPGVPQIGDVRITFKVTHPGTISILAKLNGETFEQYRAANGKTVSKLSMGTHSLENMYGEAHSANSTMTWILRFVGAGLVIVGLKMVLAPLSVIASVLPILGNIVGAGAGLVSTLLGAAWSLLIISIAWLRFRPIVGVGMLVVAAILIGLVVMRGRGAKAPAPASDATPEV